MFSYFICFEFSTKFIFFQCWLVEVVKRETFWSWCRVGPRLLANSLSRLSRNFFYYVLDGIAV